MIKCSEAVTKQDTVQKELDFLNIRESQTLRSGCMYIEANRKIQMYFSETL